MIKRAYSSSAKQVTPSHHAIARLFLTTVILAVVLSGCGAERPGGEVEPPTTSAAPVVSSGGSTEKDVLAAWRRYWDAYVAVGGELNLPDPRIAEVSTGEALRALNSGFIALKAGGEVIKGSVELSPTLVGMTEKSATLTDCYTNLRGA